MKKILSILIILISWNLIAYADFAATPKTEKEELPPVYCPKTRISDNNRCFDCHVKPDFSLKEALPYRQLVMPPGMKIVEDKPYFIIDSIYSAGAQDFFNYIFWHSEYKHVIIEVHSPGGSLLDAWKIIGLITQAQGRGITVETRCYGFAASAGFLIFVSGDIGWRKVNLMAELMWHELWSLAFLRVETPSKKEDEAKVFRHLQDTIHDWLVTRCTKEVTKDDIDKWVHHKDKWLNGKQVIEMGFAESAI